MKNTSGNCLDDLNRSMIKKFVAKLKSQARMTEKIILEDWPSDHVLSFVQSLIPLALGSDVEKCRQGYAIIRESADGFQELVLRLEGTNTASSDKATLSGSVPPGDFL